MKTFKIPFAFNSENNIVDVNTAEKNKVYTCTCGADLKLRGGEKVSNHFYHITETECSLESAIHKSYKAVFEEVKEIKLPYKVNGTDVLKFDRVELEKKIGDFIPDAIGYIGNTRYLIEFAKTSYIGERKEKKIKKANLFCLELSIKTHIKTIEDIKDHIVNDAIFKSVIHVPEYKEMKELKERFKKAYYDITDEHKKEISRLQSKITQLQYDLEFLENNKRIEGGKVNLFYVKDCSNGAKFYKGYSHDYDKEFVAFQKGKCINFKI